MSVRENIAANPAAETVKDLPRRVHIERRAFFLMKRAEPLVVNTGPLERQITGDHLNDIGAIADFIDFFVCYAPHQCLNSTSVTLSPP